MTFISKSFQTIVFIFSLHNISTAVSSGLPQVSSVYLGTEIIQPGKSFLSPDKQGHLRKVGGYSGQKSVRVFRLLSSSFCLNISAAASSGIPQVSPVYLGIEIIQPGKSFLCLDKQGTPVRIKVKVEQFRERSSVLHYGVVVIEKGAFGSSRLRSPTTTLAALYIYIYIYICVSVCVCVCLVSLFNVGYLMPKLFSQKNSCGTI